MLHVLGTLDFGGIESYLTDFIRESAPRGVRNHVIALWEKERGRLAAHYERLGCRVYSCHAVSRRWTLGREFERACAETEADVVHYHAGEMSGDAMRLGRRLRRNRLVTQAHDLGYSELRAQPYRLISRRWTLRHATRLLAVSPEAGRRLAGRSRRAVKTVPVGLDLSRWRPDPAARAARRDELGIGEDTRLLLHVGRFHPVKNHPFLLQVVERLKGRGFPAVAAFVGGGPGFGRVESLVREMVLGDHVRLLGPREDVAELMSAADLLLLPSRSEGLPRVLLEAAAVGLPFLATANADLEGVFPGGCQLPVDSAERWADEIVKRLEQGRDPVRPLIDLSINRAVDQTLEAYD